MCVCVCVFVCIVRRLSQAVLLFVIEFALGRDVLRLPNDLHKKLKSTNSISFSKPIKMLAFEENCKHKLTSNPKDFPFHYKL